MYQQYYQYYYNLKQQHQRSLFLFNMKTRGIFNSTHYPGVNTGTFFVQQTLPLPVTFFYIYFPLKGYHGLIFLLGLYKCHYIALGVQSSTMVISTY